MTPDSSINKPHGAGAPSDWVQRWSHLVPPGGAVLDVACGHGRHTRWFCALNHAVAAVEIAQAAIDSLADLASPTDQLHAGRVQTVLADIENAPWPLMDGSAPRRFDAVVVTNYLWRPLLPTLLASIAPGGVLIYETFAAGNETVGKPSRPDFLLQPSELLRWCKDMRVVAYEDGFCTDPDRFVQRIAAINTSGEESRRDDPPHAGRYPL